MQDFLGDLQLRLEAARAELTELNAYVRSLESLISLEQKRQQRAKTALPDLFHRKDASYGARSSRTQRRRRPAGQPSPIKEFLINTMGISGRMWSLDELKRAATERQMDLGGKSPGHVLHFALVALKNSGQASYDDQNKLWRLPETPPASADQNERNPLPPDRVPASMG